MVALESYNQLAFTSPLVFFVLHLYSPYLFLLYEQLVLECNCIIDFIKFHDRAGLHALAGISQPCYRTILEPSVSKSLAKAQTDPIFTFIIYCVNLFTKYIGHSLGHEFLIGLVVLSRLVLIA